MLSHFFIGFYACFVALVCYFISGSNHQHRAQTSPFGCIHYSPKHRELKEVKLHEPSHKNKPKKRSQSRPTRPEWARAKVARAVQEHCSIQKCIQTSRAFDHQQYSIQKYKTSARLVEQEGSGREQPNFTFCPIFEVSDVGPDGGSTGRAGFARIEQNGQHQLFRSY